MGITERSKKMTPIKAIVRKITGKEKCKKLRELELIPANLYGGEKKNNLNLIITKKDILKNICNRQFQSQIVEIKIGKTIEKVLTRDVQIHPISDQPIHIDFMRIGSNKINISISLNFINKNKSPGLKKGAVLNIVNHTISLKCDSKFIPEKINIDLTGLDVGDSIKTKNIKLPEKTTFTQNKDITLATIVAPSSLKAQEQTETDE